jgi:hypothetical protein
MTKSTTVKKGLNLDKGVEINRMEFSSAKFADADAVKKYLEEEGFANFVVDTKADGFEVGGVDASEFEGEVAAVKFDDEGVTVFVGKLKGEEEADKKNEGGDAANAASTATGEEGAKKDDTTPRTRTAPETDASKKGEGEEAGADGSDGQDPPAVEAPAFMKTAKGECLVKKWSYYANLVSEGKSLQDVMKDAQADGVPLGFCEVMDGFRTALSNNVKNGEITAIKGLASEMGDFLTSLAGLVVASATKSELKPAVETLMAEATKQSETTTTEGDEAKAKKAEENGEAAAEKPTTEAVIKALTERVEKLEKDQDGFAKKDDLTPLVEKSEGFSKRVTKLETVRQTRKSADVGDLVHKEPDNKDSSTVTDLTKLSKSDRNLLGVRDA